MKLMIQKLLADRFQLKFHIEKRELPVYAMVVLKTGAKLTVSAGDPNAFPGIGFGLAPGVLSLVGRNTGLDPPNIFSAFQQQLGLKLEPTKAFVDVIVIDKIARPSEN